MRESFQTIYRRACERKGGEQVLEAMLQAPLTKQEIVQIPDDRFLAEMTKKVFQSGFVWRVIEQKWPDFETVFFDFDVDKVLLMPDEMLEQKASDKRIVRNFKKVMTVRDNAMMIKDVAREYGSFAKFVTTFDKENITDLWTFLKKQGARLGGNTGPYMLRALGVDTFLFSSDVEDYLRKNDIIDGGLTAKKSLEAANQAFAHWHRESGRSLQEISAIVAYSWGTNRPVN
ncbi:DNA-3-methyladenine glycosylase I [Alteromonas sp. D210916BOD_24]|uniref:DNA-3-methyladenine glycosylase I n=1 Tax=Alteromonas sp. D210916BOD_24 TaxID=3157618 RepID=UPI00399D1FF9